MRSFFRKILYSLLTTLFGRENLLFLLTNKTERTLLQFKNEGYLYDTGWIKSVEKNEIVGNANQPLPWVSYPFIKFIENRLLPDFKLFEFGSGNSTLYYSKKVSLVHSVEHNQQWFNKIKQIMPLNVILSFCDLVYDGDYCRFAQSTRCKYNIIIIDGRDRANCCKNSIDALKADGVIVLDDSERTEYSEGISFIKLAGFKRLDFWGLAPGISYLKCTTVFYRPQNCLQI